MTNEFLNLFARRCQELGLRVFNCDHYGALAGAHVPEELREHIQSLAKTSLRTQVQTDGDLPDGLKAVALLSRTGSVTTGVTVVVAPADAVQHLSVAKWMFEDLGRTSQNEKTITQFGERLAQSYEEQTFMLKLANYLNCIEDPATVMRGVCGHLQEVLGFRWVGVIMKHLDPAAPAVRLSDSGAASIDGGSFADPQNPPTLFTAGTPPCSADDFIAQVDLAITANPERSLWENGRTPLTVTANCEVIIHPVRHAGKIVGAVAVGNKDGLDADVAGVDLQLTAATADFLGIFHENMSRFSEQQSLFVGTLRALTASIDAKDRYTCGHSERVALLGAQLARAAGLDAKTVERYRISGMVHDVGKIGVPEAVLCKPGKLTDEEFAMIKMHPEIGLRILKDIPGMSDVLPGVLHHHERWDGKGYPFKLAGEQIPLVARILGLADSFDAMSSNRAYRSALTREKVLAEIQRCAGMQFDPALAPIFVKMDFTEFDRLLAHHAPAEAQAA